MNKTTLAISIIISIAFTHVRAEVMLGDIEREVTVMTVQTPRTDAEVMALVRARIAREEQTADGAQRWHGKRISTKVIDDGDVLIKYEKYEDGFVRTERAENKKPLSLDEYLRVINARREAMIKLAEREPNVPKALRDARRKAIDDLKVVTNTVVTTVRNIAENGANEQK